MRSICNTSELRTLVHVLRASPGCSQFHEAIDALFLWLDGKSELPQVENLDNDYLDRGPVYKQPLCDTGPYTFSLLCLPPNTAISEHLHDEDKESYMIVDMYEKQWLEIRHCPMGESHSLDNPTKEDRIVLSIKERP